MWGGGCDGCVCTPLSVAEIRPPPSPLTPYKILDTGLPCFIVCWLICFGYLFGFVGRFESDFSSSASESGSDDEGKSKPKEKEKEKKKKSPVKKRKSSEPSPSKPPKKKAKVAVCWSTIVSSLTPEIWNDYSFSLLAAIWDYIKMTPSG